MWVVINRILTRGIFEVALRSQDIVRITGEHGHTIVVDKFKNIYKTNQTVKELIEAMESKPNIRQR